MSLKMNLWRVSGDKFEEIAATRLDLEDRLESWIASNSSVLGMEILIIGRQVQTEFGGRIDLLGIDRQANCVIIELKRGKTPREIVAQVLDYASWVKDLGYSHLDNIASSYLGRGLSEAFSDEFHEPTPETVNASHSMLIVASELDDSSQRIVEYLSEQHGININAVFFDCFKTDHDEFLGRAWLKDPIEVLERSESKKQAPWSGYWFVNVGEGSNRNWDDNQKYEYIAAGQGSKFSRSLKRLKVGDKLFAYMAGRGYVGYGEVIGEAMMIRDFIVSGQNKHLLDLPLQAPRADENSDNPDLSEWIVPVRWLRTFSREQARTFNGVFANQNVVCKLRHLETVEFLRREFGAA